MEHYARVIFDGPFKMQLDETVVANYSLMETVQGQKVIHIPLPRMLMAEEADTYAEKLANYMLECGLKEFDIDISTDIVSEDLEETLLGNDFYEAYGVMYYNEDDILDEAEYQGRKVPLGKPMQGDVAKFKVYVKNPKGNVVKVNFGDKDMKIKKSNPKRRKSFRARHNCDNPGPRHMARYWSCRKW